MIIPISAEQRKLERAKFEYVIVRMFLDRISDENFYAQVLSQTKVTMVRDIKTLGVYFKNGTYYLDINPDYFNSLTEDEQVAVIKHEMDHILNKHLTTRGDFPVHEQANVAMDMAINQFIKGLPANCVDYRRHKFPPKLNTEQYYELLEDDVEFQEYLRKKQELQEKFEKMVREAIENGQLNEDGEPCDGDGNPFEVPEGMTHDRHNWEKMSDDDKELLESTTKDIIERAISKTIGKTPHNISELLDLFSKKPQVNWRKALRNMVGNTKSNKRSTIKRRPRRFKDRSDLRGTTTDTTFKLICLLDVSGSMSDAEILVPLQEIREICKLTNTEMKVIQVDTEVKEVTNFTKNTTRFTRSGMGGTYMYDGIRYLYENKIEFDGIVFISDLFIENIESCWEIRPKAPIFWLTNTPESRGEQVQNYPRMKRFLIDVAS